MNNRTILFDLDGTLIDSAPDVCRALNRTLSTYGRRAHSVDEIKGYLGHGARILMEKALSKTGAVPEPETIDQLTNAFLTDYAENPVIDSTLFPGVISTLEKLKANGETLAICTNKPSITTAPVLEIFKLRSYFKAIVCGDQVKNKKPSGGHIIDTIKAANGTLSNAIMIGDSENDIYAAIDAGIPSIAVTFGYSVLPIEDLGANILINHYDDMIGAITSLCPDQEIKHTI